MESTKEYPSKKINTEDNNNFKWEQQSVTAKAPIYIANSLIKNFGIRNLSFFFFFFVSLKVAGSV